MHRICHILFLWVLLFPGGAGLMAHEFYVSISEYRYNDSTECLEVSLRVFTDDMDRALELISGISCKLLSRMEHPAADSLLVAYLQQNLELELDGRQLKLEYLGKEAEADAMWCYLESEALPRPDHFRIRNCMLTEAFPDQVNICQFYLGAWNRALLLSRDQCSGELRYREASSRGR